MGGLEAFADPNLLYGTNPGDDTGVYRLREDLALVQTVDFFTPIVDDPYLFGQIAAANALSDLFTMGAQPVTGLNLVSFPRHMDIHVLGRILEGGADKMRESGGVIVGGHSVDDPEPKYGIAVTGTVDPRKMITNKGARVGDKLVLTKKIGTGIITNLNKRGNPLLQMARSILGKNGKLREGLVEEAATSMITLNQKASQLMIELGGNACTDITGFGLLGHLHNLMEASGHRAQVYFSRVPQFDGILPHAISGTAGGGHRNKEWTQSFVQYKERVEEEMAFLLNDAQTSGPLLIAVDGEKADALVDRFHVEGVAAAAAVIGEVVEGPAGTIEVDV